MGYDCSINKRKGCNYCIRGKLIPKDTTKGEITWFIDDDVKELQAGTEDIVIKINFTALYAVRS